MVVFARPYSLFLQGCFGFLCSSKTTWSFFGWGVVFSVTTAWWPRKQRRDRKFIFRFRLPMKKGRALKINFLRKIWIPVFIRISKIYTYVPTYIIFVYILVWTNLGGHCALLFYYCIVNESLLLLVKCQFMAHAWFEKKVYRFFHLPI